MLLNGIKYELIILKLGQFLIELNIFVFVQDEQQTYFIIWFIPYIRSDIFNLDFDIDIGIYLYLSYFFGLF